MSRPSPVSTVIAMRVPSGLQLGSKWYQGPRVSCSATPPAAGTRQMSPAMAKAIHSPSGDHAGLIGPVLTGGSMWSSPRMLPFRLA